MSSLLSQFKQPLTKRLVAFRGVYSTTLANIKQKALANNATEQNNFFLFNNETDLATAIYQIENTSDETSAQYGPEHYTDMGKSVYLGLKRGESAMFTYTLVQAVDEGASENDGYGIMWLITDLKPSKFVVNKINDLAGGPSDGYGHAWVARAY